jgi:uncharacterized protein (DUF58 family)
MLHQNTQHFKSLDFFARQTVEGFITGLHKSPFHGFSVEFAEHRVYNQGDSTKAIDWKLFAKTDNLFVKRFEDETNLRCHLLLDTSSSMDYPQSEFSKKEFAVKAAAVISYLLKKQRDAFSLTCFSQSIDWQSEVRSSNSHYLTLLNQLEFQRNQSSTNKKTDIVPVLHLMAEKISRRSLVILFTDLYDSSLQSTAFFDAINHLRYKKHEVILFHIVAGREELALDFAPGPHRFVDKETGEELKLNIEDVKEVYKSRIAQFAKEAKEKSLQFGIDYVEVDTYQGFEQVMLPFLVKRRKMS